MNNNILVIVVFCLMCSNIAAQNTQHLDTVYKTEDTLLYYSIIDNNEIKAVSPENGKYFVYVNGASIDSNGLKMNDLPIAFNGVVFFNSKSSLSNQYKKVFFKNNKSETYSSVFSYDNGLKHLYKIGSDLLKIYSFNPITSESKLYCDFGDVIQKEVTDEGEEPLEEIVDVFFITPTSCIVKICFFGPYSSCWKSRYFLVKDDGYKEEITAKFNYKTDKEIESFTSSIQFVSNGFVREKIDLQVIENKSYHQLQNNRLFDNDFSVVSELLYMTPQLRGVNSKNGNVQFYYLRSIVNNQKSVLLPYKFIPELDLAMYKAYNNSTLSKEDIKGFGKYELGILRNLIFAKHNYDFSSEFYQAYFNLYAFYNATEMRNTRTKDVNEKLTGTDKVNLGLIKSME